MNGDVVSTGTGITVNNIISFGGIAITVFNITGHVGAINVKENVVSGEGLGMYVGGNIDGHDGGLNVGGNITTNTGSGISVVGNIAAKTVGINVGRNVTSSASVAIEVGGTVSAKNDNGIQIHGGVETNGTYSIYVDALISPSTIYLRDANPDGYSVINMNDVVYSLCPADQ